MPLPTPPVLSGDNTRDIQTIQLYLYDLMRNFNNSVGEAIDPTLGRGGDGALDIVDIPTGIVYTPGATLYTNDVVLGHVDIQVTFPTRSVDVIAYYKESTVANFNTFVIPSNNYRIPNLKPNTNYDIQLSGRSANGIIGPASSLTVVAIPTIAVTTKAPADASYLVSALNSVLTNERLITDTATIAWDVAVANIVKANVPDSSITTLKKADFVNSTTAISLTGTGAAFEALIQTVTVTHNLNKRVVVIPSLESAANETSSARFCGVFLTANDVNSFTIRVVGIFASSTTNITATLNSRYW